MERFRPHERERERYEEGWRGADSQRSERGSPWLRERREFGPDVSEEGWHGARIHGTGRYDELPRNYGEWRESSREPSYERDPERRMGGEGRGYGGAYGSRERSMQDYYGESQRSQRGDWGRPQPEARGDWGGAYQGGQSYQGQSRQGYGGGYQGYGDGGGGRGGTRMFTESSGGEIGSYAGGYQAGYGGTQGGYGGYQGGYGYEDGGRGMRGYSGSAGEMGSYGGLEREGSARASGTTYAGRGPKGFQRSDERLRELVCERLEDAPDVDASECEVEIKQGEVTLKGTVPSRRMKHRAEEIIENLPGVRDVTNQLRVQDRSDREGRSERTTAGSSTSSGASSFSGTSSSTTKSASRPTSAS